MCRQLPTYFVTICNHLIVSIVINYLYFLFVYMKYYTVLCGTQLQGKALQILTLTFKYYYYEY